VMVGFCVNLCCFSPISGVLSCVYVLRSTTRWSSEDVVDDCGRRDGHGDDGGASFEIDQVDWKD